MDVMLTHNVVKRLYPFCHFQPSLSILKWFTTHSAIDPSLFFLRSWRRHWVWLLISSVLSRKTLCGRLCLLWTMDPCAGFSSGAWPWGQYKMKLLTRKRSFSTTGLSVAHHGQLMVCATQDQRWVWLMLKLNPTLLIFWVKQFMLCLKK